MASKSAAAAALLVLGVACSPSHDRFENARDVAEALQNAGVPCRYTFVHGPTRRGESAGQCIIDKEGATIHVLGDEEALQQLKGIEAGTADDTPRIYWVYGENWFIATESHRVQERVRDAVGGEIANNTQF